MYDVLYSMTMSQGICLMLARPNFFVGLADVDSALISASLTVH